MIYKRGKIYWYKFMWQGKLVRESTQAGQRQGRRQMESAHRTSLAKGEVGIRDKKPVADRSGSSSTRGSSLGRRQHLRKSSPKTWLDWYRVGLRAIKGYKPLADSMLNEITARRSRNLRRIDRQMACK